MKYYFKLTLICLFFSLPAFSEDLIAKYKVKTNIHELIKIMMDSELAKYT